MFFAFAEKCGGLDAIGLTEAAAAAPKSSCSLSNEARAMEPSPSAQRLKNWRRVRKRRSGCVGKWLMAFCQFVAAGIHACRGAAASSPAERIPHIGEHSRTLVGRCSLAPFFRASGSRPLHQAEMPDATGQGF